MRNATDLYLGRLANLTPLCWIPIERAVVALHDPKVLRSFYAKLATLGLPAAGPSALGLLEEGPFPLPTVDFATLTDALRQDDLTGPDLTGPDLAALVSRIRLPLRPERLEALSVRVDGGKKLAPYPLLPCDLEPPPPFGPTCHGPLETPKTLRRRIQSVGPTLRHLHRALNTTS